MRATLPGPRPEAGPRRFPSFRRWRWAVPLLLVGLAFLTAGSGADPAASDRPPVASDSSPADSGAPPPALGAPPAAPSPDPCEEEVAEPARHPDLYCIQLVPSARAREAAGSVELRRLASPFGVEVTADGRHRHRVVMRLRGLPEPGSLGPYTTYVAWAVTPTLSRFVRLGEVGNGTRTLGTVSFDKYLVWVSAEASLRVAERTGPLVLRGQSPSSRMKPADFLEFLLGATNFDGETADPRGEEEPAAGRDAPDVPAARHAHGAGREGDPKAWPRPPMPEGLTMLPALMRLSPPPVAPWLPAPPPDARVPDASPRRLIPLRDGDSVSLEAGWVRRRVGNRSHVTYGYNGQVPGPLFLIPQGATITVGFRNRIDAPTTVHWHGIRLENRFDGVPGLTQELVPPGGEFRYEVRVPDAGIYWYHPHHREDVQQDLGLAGNLMVRPSRDDYYGPANREETLLLDDLLLGETGLVPYGREGATHTLMGRFGNVLLVNGEPHYGLEVARGEVVRLFLTNAASTRTFNLSIPGAELKLVGSDVGNYEREAWVESVPIAPAERYVVHARFPAAGEYPLLNRVIAIDHLAGAFFPEVDTLGRIRVGPEPVAEDHSAAFARLRAHPWVVEEVTPLRRHVDRPPDLRLDLDMEARDLPLVVDRLMRLDSAYFHPVEWSGTMPMMNWISTAERARWILREPEVGRENMEIDWRFRVGDRVKIRIRNRREALHAMQHPIHIHGQRFLVLAQDGVPNDNLVWKDTALVPVGSSVDILLELSNPGRWMLHCHIAEHLDSGMMLAFTVDPP